MDYGDKVKSNIAEIADTKSHSHGLIWLCLFFIMTDSCLDCSGIGCVSKQHEIEVLDKRLKSVEDRLKNVNATHMDFKDGGI